ncbi:MAG: ATP-binding protein [Pyrinomonadaceae bacterium]
MKENRKDYTIVSKISEIDGAVTKATDFARKQGFSDDDIFGIDMAMREAVANAVKHGNRLDETKNVEISLSESGTVLSISVRDFGEGFSVDAVPDPTNPENLLKESGRGILFMQTFVDRVEWHNHSEGGMIVKMTKTQA